MDAGTHDLALVRATDRSRLFWWRRATSAAPRLPPLTEEEIRKAISIYSPAIVKELYETTLRQIQNETGRQSRLDSKATSLLTATGLSLTVAFTLGGQLLIGQADKWAGMPPVAWKIAAGIYWFTVGAGLVASVFAVSALRIRDEYRSINERNVFDAEVLDQTDQRDEKDEGITVYRRHLIPHMWVIAQKHSQNHNKKATKIRYGQGFFAGFLVGLVLIGAGMGWQLISKGV
jgi:hypothetical protein